MATPKPSAAPAAPAPKPEIAPEKRANEAMALAGKKGSRIWKPFRYLGGFLKGSVEGALDGTAQWAKRGMWVGVLATIGIGLMTGGVGSLLYPALMMGVMGFASGAAIGAVGGLVAGGIHGVGRQYRAEKYADDLIVREKAKTVKPAAPADYRDPYRAQQSSYYMLDRVQQQQRELREEVASHSWQDRVMGGHGGWMR